MVNRLNPLPSSLIVLGEFLIGTGFIFSRGGNYVYFLTDTVEGLQPSGQIYDFNAIRLEETLSC